MNVREVLGFAFLVAAYGMAPLGYTTSISRRWKWPFPGVLLFLAAHAVKKRGADELPPFRRAPSFTEPHADDGDATPKDHTPL